jgi:hypothetical protein
MAHDSDSHLQRMIVCALRQMGPAGQQGLQEMSRSFHVARHGRLTVGTMFSGTDIGLKVVDAVCQALAAELQADPVTPVHLFSCEKSARKIAWIRTFFRPKLLFNDAAQLGQDWAWDVVSQRARRVPRVDLLLAGSNARISAV